MKRTTLFICAGFVCCGLTTLAQAQENNDSKPASVPARPAVSAVPANAGPGNTGTAVRPMSRDRSEYLARLLSLTDEQREKVKPILDEETKQIQEIRDKTQEKLKAILTPEQLQRYSRSTGNFQNRLQSVVRPAASGGTPATPATPAAPAAPATPAPAK